MINDRCWPPESEAFPNWGGQINKKNPKNFSRPFPLFEKGPYWRKHWYFVHNSNYKVRFFWNLHPPPISSESGTSSRWPLSQVTRSTKFVSLFISLLAYLIYKLGLLFFLWYENLFFYILHHPKIPSAFSKTMPFLGSKWHFVLRMKRIRLWLRMYGWKWWVSKI